MTLDLRRPKGQRVVDLLVRCSKCKYPRYNPIQMDEIYKVATVNYLLNGGDGHVILKENKKNSQPGQFYVIEIILFWVKLEDNLDAI